MTACGHRHSVGKIGEEKLIHKLWLNLAALLANSAEEDTTQQAVAIEPVRFSAEVLIGNRVAAVAYVLAAREL